MRVLDLFSGSQSVGKVCKELGWECISLDSEHKADIQANILTWDYKVFKPHDFDIITASPPCKYFSSLRYCNIGRRIAGQDAVYTKKMIEEERETVGKPLVDKAREIIEYLKPRFFWIENPQTGRMKDYITDLPFYDVDYCQYGFGYRKRTRFWTNITGFTPRLCAGFGKCKSMVGKRHRITLSEIGGGNYRLKRYRIPPELIKELFQAV